LVLKLLLAAYTPNPSCVPNVKLLPSTVAEIGRGTNLCLDLTLSCDAVNDELSR